MSAAKHTPVGPCIEWQKARDEDGYGRVSQGGKWRAAHRVAWEKASGPIPAGMTIDHLCRNRACVNPRHLEPVTNRVNVLRGIGPTAQNARATHCRNGHVLEAIGSRRGCKECSRARWRAYRNRKIAEGTWART